MLNKLNSEYLQQFYYIEKSGQKFSFPKMKKDELAQLFALICSTRVLFEKLLSSLSEDVKLVFYTLVWQGGIYPVEKLMAQLNAPILKSMDIINTANNDKSYGYPQYNPPQFYISNRYSLFSFKTDYLYYNYSSNGGKYPYEFKIFLNETLRKQFKQYLPKPEGYNLNVVESVDQAQFVYCDKNDILTKINILKNYILQGYLTAGKNGKILKTSIQQMATYCHIKEFYELSSTQKDKSLQFIRTELIIDFLMRYTLKADDKDDLPFLKSQFLDFFDQKSIELNPVFNRLMNHVKGYTYYTSDQKRHYQIKQSFADILKTLPLMQWVSVDNIINYANYRDVFLEVVERRDYILSRLFVKIETKNMSSHYNNKISISDMSYNDVVTAPFLKGFLFLMASFGILDIAYNYPLNPSYQQVEKPYLTEYDGLQYVRLTELGAFILGITDNYDVKIEKEEGNIILDENRLMMRIEGKDTFKKMILEKIAEKIHANNYKVTYSSFLKDCYSIEAVEDKIKLFKKHISSKPSEIWQTFFKEVQGKINPLIPKTSLLVYEIQPSSELINLIAKDETLRKYILKAEKYHIVIDASKRSKIKKRLEEFGFFIDNI